MGGQQRFCVWKNDAMCKKGGEKILPQDFDLAIRASTAAAAAELRFCMMAGSFSVCRSSFRSQFEFGFLFHRSSSSDASSSVSRQSLLPGSKLMPMGGEWNPTVSVFVFGGSEEKAQTLLIKRCSPQMQKITTSHVVCCILMFSLLISHDQNAAVREKVRPSGCILVRTNLLKLSWPGGLLQCILKCNALLQWFRRVHLQMTHYILQFQEQEEFSSCLFSAAAAALMLSVWQTVGGNIRSLSVRRTCTRRQERCFCSWMGKAEYNFH